MEKKNPRHGNGTGSLNHGAHDETEPNRKTLKLQFNCADPAIYIRKDGPLFRVMIVPALQLEPSSARPETYAGILAARQAAAWLAKATGLRIVDLTGGQP